MAIRFTLEVPRDDIPSLLTMLEASRDAEALTVRNSEDYLPDNPVTDVTVVAEDLTIIDRLYEWQEAGDGRQAAYLNLYHGDRYRLDAYDIDSLKHAIETDLEEAASTAPQRQRPVVVSRAGNAPAEVPYGGKMTDGTALIPATTKLTFGAIDHIALRVRDIARAERFYRTFFGMDVMYRARLRDDRWEQFDEAFDWTESIHTGERPELVRLENAPLTLTLIDVGGGKILHEARIDHVSVTAPVDVLAEIRGRALFHSFTIEEDTPVAFRFVDPYGMIWQIVADDTLNQEPVNGAR